MNIRTLFSSWEYDPISSVLTLIVTPIVIYIFAVVKKPLFARIKYLVLGTTYHISARLNKAAAASLSLRRDRRLHIAGSSKYLFVPAARDVHLETDAIFVPLILERAGSKLDTITQIFLKTGTGL
jgi:hypothetical protein